MPGWQFVHVRHHSLVEEGCARLAPVVAHYAVVSPEVTPPNVVSVRRQFSPERRPPPTVSQRVAVSCVPAQLLVRPHPQQNHLLTNAFQF